MIIAGDVDRFILLYDVLEILMTETLIIHAYLVHFLVFNIGTFEIRICFEIRVPYFVSNAKNTPETVQPFYYSPVE